MEAPMHKGPGKEEGDGRAPERSHVRVLPQNWHRTVLANRAGYFRSIKVGTKTASIRLSVPELTLKQPQNSKP